MRYDASVDLENDNTSHALVVRLVGQGKRVLDVGCATGYLAEALTKRGNRVWGVETDEEAAELARPHLEGLLVGDVESSDLKSEFGAESFDVIVFADVLEHLRDPTTVLTYARELLVEGGFVVISIPNVAHASVRLSLLKGRFDYQSLGLLDDTHLRFFTRRTLHAMLENAGFAASEELRTTAPPFETEIPVLPHEVPPEVVAGISADPDAETYQFVIKAVPLMGGHRRSDGEERSLETALAQIVAALARIDERPVVGVIDASSDRDRPVGAIRLAVCLTEIRRRMADFQVRLYSPSDLPETAALGDEPALPLPRDADEVEALRSDVGEMIVISSRTANDDKEIRRRLELIDGAGVRLVTWPGDGDVADPLALVSRLADSQLVTQRWTQLASVGRVPSGLPTILTYFDDIALRDSCVSGIDSLADSLGAEEFPGQGANALDLLTMVAGSGHVVTDDMAVATLAASLKKPTWVVTSRMSSISPRLLSLGVRVEAPGGGFDGVPSAVVSHHAVVLEADSGLDRLADTLLRGIAGPLARQVPQLAGMIAERIGSLETANNALRQQLLRERLTTASLMHDRAGHTDTTHVTQGEIIRLVKAEERLSAEVGDLKEEISRIYGTRTMRLLQPGRALYGRLRNLRG